MKSKPIAFLALICFSFTAKAQELYSGNQSFVPLKYRDILSISPLEEQLENKFILNSYAQKPTTIKERVRVSTSFDDGVTRDSTYYIFSGNRGSSPGNYFGSSHQFDSTYMSSSGDGFATLFPLNSRYYNDEDLFTKGYSYSKSGIKTGWFTNEYYSGSLIKNSENLNYYLNTNGSFYEDSFLVRKEYTATGKLQVDLRIQYLPNVMGNNSQLNYRNRTDYLYDASDRLNSYEYKYVPHYNNLSYDSTRSLLFRFYPNNTSNLALKDSVFQSYYSGSTVSDSIVEFYYVYDNNQNLITSTRLVNGINRLKTSYVYDASNNCIQKLEESYNNGLWVNFQKTEYSYDGNILVLELSSYWSNNQWQEGSKDLYTINSLGLIISHNSYYDGQLYSREIIKYTPYNNVKQFKTEQFQNVNGVDSMMTSGGRNYYYDEYDDLGISSNFIQEISCLFYPNPFNSTINLRIKEEMANQEYELKITDISGRLLETQKIKKVLSSISTQKLSPGIYFISLENKNKNTRTIEKIIKH